MILVFKGGGPKVNQTNIWLQKHLSLRHLPTCSRRNGGNFAVICECLIGSVVEENIFWLQVGMHELQIVQDYSRH